MAHCLISGMTESGKTTLAKSMAARYSAANKNIIVLDPMLDPAWQADFITDDPDEFLKVFWSNTGCMAFIDEAGESAGHYDKAMIKTATRGRHWGHVCHYLSQRPALLSKTIRGQCKRLYLFNVELDDCKTLHKEFNDELLLTAKDLPQGQFLAGGRFEKFKHHKLF